MESSVSSRDMSPSEREFLHIALEGLRTGDKRWSQAVENAFVMWAASCLVLCLVWWVIGWLLRSFAHLDLGWHSRAAMKVLPTIVLIGAAMSMVSMVRWMRSWRDTKPLLLADLRAGRVEEEHYVFTEALRFQEQEHGGLIYFLRTSDERVLTLFDPESQDLGVRGGDPLASGFRPMTRLVMVRAPETRYVLDKRFSGEPLYCALPVTLAVNPRLWPESEEYCDVPWGELRTRLG